MIREASYSFNPLGFNQLQSPILSEMDQRKVFPYLISRILAELILSCTAGCPPCVSVPANLSLCGSPTRTSIPVLKCDRQQSSKRSDSPGSNPHEITANQSHANGERLERAVIEMRLRRIIRRFQRMIRRYITRLCELRLFAALRMQFVFRSRSRTRAALRIQRFVRNMLRRKRHHAS